MDFSDSVINWYNENKRDLPWRDTTDAYTIWLSEIILQQTRVEQGKPYFYRFAEKYPTVADFAAAPEDDILKLWQGLGYYSRGRNMLATAKMVVADFEGKFPERYQDLIKLKGIGEYTAAAISSFAADEPKAVVDGNVYRVLARYFGITEAINSTIGKKIFQKTANNVLNTKHSALHNQAVMEFGAMLCRPKSPACGMCPINTGCYAFLNNAAQSLPVKIKKLKVRNRYFNYVLIRDGNKILLNKRGEKDIWANMYDLPLIETTDLPDRNELEKLPALTGLFGYRPGIDEIDGPYKHVLTHQRLYVNFILTGNKPTLLKDGWFYTDTENLKKFALPKIIFIFLTKFFKFKFNLSLS